MAEGFVALDLSEHWNVGDGNVETDAGRLWPAPEGAPDRTPLKRLPEGACTFWGVPFRLADRKENPDSKAFVAVAKSADGTVPERASIPISSEATHVLFAHVCAPSAANGGALEGGGEEIAAYRVVYADGTQVVQQLRRRFEIHDVEIPWGHHPFLCRHCRETRSLPLDDRKGSWGGVQVGTDQESGGLQGWWLYDWLNPQPEKTIEHIEVEARSSTGMALGGITLCLDEGDPLAWAPREEVAVHLEKEPDPAQPLEVEMDRGVIARQDDLIVPDDEYTATDETGWGRGGQHFERGAYLEVHGSPDARLRVGAKDGKGASFRWGDVLEQKAGTHGQVQVSLVSPQGKQWVHVRVVDAGTGQPVGCRVHFRSAQGAYFAPHGHHADVNVGWFEHVGGDCKVRGVPYAYIDGTCQIELPVGTVLVEAVRGFEYAPVRQRVEIKPGQKHLSLKLERAFDMKQRRFYSGDTHVHFLSSQSSHLEAAAEDLNVVNLLASQWGRLFTSWQEFTGGLAPTSSNEHLVWVSQENRQHVLGHISLLGLKEQIAPMCTGGPDEDWIGGEIQTLIADWSEACRSQGGLVIVPHMPTPDFENAADVVLGKADAAEMCWVWQGEEIGQGELGYYRWLNAGQKLPVVGGTDKMSNGRVLGGSRTYALLPDDQPFTFENWVQAVRRGTTFASTGAMIDLWSEGKRMGEEVSLPGNGGTVEVVATAESVWPLTAVELIVNGRRAARQMADGDRRRVSVKFELKAESSCWVAARCWGPYFTDAGPVMAHSSPIYISVGGGRAFESTDAEYLLTHMEGGIAWSERLGVFRDEAVRARLIALFREAQDELRTRMGKSVGPTG